MARLPRPDLAGIAQHVVQRGNDRLPCFYDDDDRRRYLTALQHVAQRYACLIHAYVLMTNHVHLLATPSAAGAISRMMQTLGRLYVADFNGRHRRTGTLWEGRYRSCLVGGARYVLACHRYMELNPVRAAIVAQPSGFPWSSYAPNATGRPDAVLRPHPDYLALAGSNEQRQAAYRTLFDEVLPPKQIAEIRVYIQQQRALGSDRFQAAVERKLGRCAVARPAHRPRAEKAL
jgi:putative transposase